jgi:glyoxylase-like metal-dependent hydrolase (beta-lactamase superfamily II)
MTTLAAAASFIHQSENLLSWNVYDPVVKADLTSNAILSQNGWWFIDPIYPPDGYQAVLNGRPVLGILLTNENHERDARLMARELGAKVYAHEAAKPHLHSPPNGIFKDKKMIDQGPMPYFIPGPSYGETAYFFKEQKILTIGDALINLSQTGFTFLPDKYCQDRTLAKTNLKLLLDIEFETITFAHGAPLTNSKKNFLKLIQTV